MDEELDFEGYCCHRFDRDLGQEKWDGGGIVIYTKNHYEFEPLPEWNLCTADCEMSWEG